MSLQENRGILMAEIVGNSSESVYSDEFPTNPSVGIVSSEKKNSSEFRQNFRRLSDEYRETSFWRTSDDITMRLHETRVHRKTTIPTNVVPRFIPTNCRRRNLPTDIGRRNIPTNHVRRYIPTEMSLSVNSDGYMSVGIFRRPLSVGIYPFFFTN